MSEVLSAVSQALVETVEAAGAGVVRVEARGRLSSSGIVWPSDSLIVTAHHTVERSDDIRVGLPEGGAVAAELVGRDPGTDLAVLRLRSQASLTALDWVEPDAVRVGTLVLALGRPGANVLATLGIVSAVDGIWRTPAGGELDHYLQADVVMYPGFSGGPLVNADRRVAGMNTSGLAGGLGLAIPAPTVRTVVASLLKHGRVRRGYLGVGAQAVPLPEGLGQQAAQSSGLILVMVEPGGPAERGGLLLGDILLSLGGHPLRAMDDLLAALGAAAAGAALPIRLIRGGQLKELTVAAGERPA